jgi:uncharacterized protein involved in exopolysaccharide biosynthesis/Mrp family chromosome partitioning ATPase
MLREVYITNRIEEIKSRSVAEAVVEQLPPTITQKLAAELDSTDINFDGADALVELINGRPPKKKGRVKVERIRKSDIVKISFWAKDPEAAYVVTNTLTTQYVNRHIQVRRESAGGIRSFLEEQLGIYREKLKLAEVALKSFKENSQITVLDRQAGELLTRYTQAEVVYNTTRAESSAKEHRRAYLEQKISEEKRELVPSLTNISSPWSQKLKNKLVDLELQYTELQLQNYSSDHPLMAQMREKINQTKNSLTSEAMKLAKGEGLLDAFSHLTSYLEESLRLQIELETIRKKEQAIKNILDRYDDLIKDFPAKELHLARLTRERNVSEQTYLMLIQKREEARLSEAEGRPAIRIVDKAKIPKAPIWPRKRLNIILGILLGGFLGIGTVIFAESMQDTIESKEDVETETGWSVVATIPKFRNGKKDPERNNIKRLAQPVGGNGGNSEGNNTKKMIAAPSSITLEAEVYGMLARNIQLLLQKENTGLILITSSSPQEGKSTTAVNLAITLANMGQNTLLVDMDFRRPIIHKVFDIPMRPGAMDLLLQLQSFDGELNGKKQITKQTADDSKSSAKPKNIGHLSTVEDIFDAIQPTTVKSLNVLPSGPSNDGDPTHLSSGHISIAFDLFRRLFDSVVVDGPPLLMVSEANIMASLADGVIYVSECGYTPKKAVQQSQKVLEIAKANVVGSVLNKIDLTRTYGKRGHYYYY